MLRGQVSSVLPFGNGVVEDGCVCRVCRRWKHQTRLSAASDSCGHATRPCTLLLALPHYLSASPRGTLVSHTPYVMFAVAVRRAWS